MEIDKIKDHIVQRLNNDYNVWNDVLNNTQPENYACDHWRVDINPTDISVDIPGRTFSVNDGFFSFDVTLESAKDDRDISYNKAFTAKGTFQFENMNNIKISHFVHHL
jgi:hypothetical protein